MMSLLDGELEPAVQQLLVRNQDLERENEMLTGKVESLMAELSALRAKRRSFAQSVESFATSQVGASENPAKKMKRKVKQQEDQISRLESLCTTAVSDIETVQKEKRQLEEYLDQETTKFQKTQDMESEARSSVQKVTELLSCIIPQSALSEETAQSDLLVAMETLQKHVSILKESWKADEDRKKTIETERNFRLERIRELESRIRALETEKSAIDESNRRYQAQREELGKAIETLSGALDEVKEELISAEDEKKKLKEENAKLWKERNSLI
jgi:chromosome segregation ATPase